jgi:hypothetical protein
VDDVAPLQDQTAYHGVQTGNDAMRRERRYAEIVNKNMNPDWGPYKSAGNKKGGCTASALRKHSNRESWDQVPTASDTHFLTLLVLAAPASFLSEAVFEHAVLASFWHFVMKLLSAAPASFLSVAWALQVVVGAAAAAGAGFGAGVWADTAVAKRIAIEAKAIRFIADLQIIPATIP